jgi:superfamily II DNA/RNA helicase
MIEQLIPKLEMHTVVTFVFSPQNLIAQSQSGTGKTAAFSLAMLSHVNPANKWTQVSLMCCCSLQ